ncbi:MAG: S41 family peptidase, partial [Patescibacteria group bacterium]
EWIKEIFSNLDPHSRYLDKEEFNSFTETTNGHYEGIGIRLKFQKKSPEQDKQDNNLETSPDDCAGFLAIITEVFPNQTAEKTGLLPEDIIIKINNQDISDWCFVHITKELKGNTGSIVEITVLRKNQELTFKLTRETIKINPVASDIFQEKLLKFKIGYLKIESFSSKGVYHILLGKALELIEKGAENLILDLRGNHGGLLSEAIDVTDLFLEETFLTKKKIISVIKGKDGAKYAPFFTFKKDGYISSLFIIVDAKSASAAEIVASALQDHGTAIIVGVPTFGKASVQMAFPLLDGGAALITIGRYFRPNGQTLQWRGVTPDIIIPKETPREEKPEKREQDTKNALKPIGDEPPAIFSTIEKKYKDDFQLMRTLEIIRSFEIIKIKNKK